MSLYIGVNMSFAKQTCEYTQSATFTRQFKEACRSINTPFSQFETTIQTIYINTNPLYYEQTLSAREYWVT